MLKFHKTWTIILATFLEITNIGVSTLTRFIVSIYSLIC